MSNRVLLPLQMPLQLLSHSLLKVLLSLWYHLYPKELEKLCPSLLPLQYSQEMLLAQCESSFLLLHLFPSSSLLKIYVCMQLPSLHMQCRLMTADHPSSARNGLRDVTCCDSKKNVMNVLSDSVRLLALPWQDGSIRSSMQMLVVRRCRWETVRCWFWSETGTGLESDWSRLTNN